MYRRRNGPLPRIPLTEHEEHPNTEILIQPDQNPALHPHRHDKRPEVVKPYENVLHPEMNRLYGSLRVEDGWEKVVDNYSNGSLTTVAGQVVQSSVKLLTPAPETRLSRWPGAVQLYLCIRSFSFALSTATLATQGSLDVYYQDTIGGQTIPLGSMASTDELNLLDVHYLIPTPITDAGLLTNAIGNIQATLSAGATVGTYIWQLGVSYAYLLPTNKPYDVQHVEDLLDAHPGHIH